MLLSAHDVAGAPELKVAHGDFESAAELGKFPYRLKALLLYFAEHLAAAEGKISVGAARASAHSSPQLVKLRKPHAVGVLDNKRVCVRQIDARFDNGGAHKYVDFLGEHLPPHLAELLLVHLAVAYGYPRLGDCLVYAIGG